MTQSQPEISFVKSNWDSISGIHRFSHKAMATTFETIILHPDARYARQAAWAAFDELDSLETELSRFIENSDISRINNLAAGRALRVGSAAFECLQLCTQIYNETGGAFDITVGPLVDYWLSQDKTGRTPSKEQFYLARRRTGTHLLKLDETGHTVELLTDKVQIDLGGLGKGYAVDQMAKLLRDWSIDIALIHAGYSSVLALDPPPDMKGWPLTLSNPGNRKQTLAHLHLQNRALSGSGLQKSCHIIDPRTAQPVKDKSAAWVCAPTAAISDALSTAFMVMSPGQVRQYCLSHPDTLAMLVMQGRGKKGILHFGPWKENELL